MPMGTLNAAPTFVAMMMKLKNGMGHTSQRTWFENAASKIIVYGVLLYGRTAEQLLAYFRTVLGVLKHHCATLKLKKCK